MAGKTEGQSVQIRGETCIGDDGGMMEVLAR